MLVKFIKQCMDKNTNEMYYSGMVKEFDDDRAKEIIKTGYAIEFKESKIERAIEVQDTLVDPNVVKVDLESLTLKELKKKWLVITIFLVVILVILVVVKIEILLFNLQSGWKN